MRTTFNNRVRLESIRPFPSYSICIEDYSQIIAEYGIASNEKISNELLLQMKQLSMEHKNKINEFYFLLPSDQRDLETERIISGNLKHSFQRNYDRVMNSVVIARKKGIIFSIVGAIIISLSVYLSFFVTIDPVIRTIAFLSQSLGWYFEWISYKDVFRNDRDRRSELEIYFRLSKSRIGFSSAEERKRLVG